MYSLTSLFLVILASTAYSSDVLDLSDSDFQASVDGKDIMLVEFFAPWCGHCKRLAPEYEIAATALKKEDPPIPLAKVDCTEAGKSTCSQQGVSGYPTLKIFRNGKVNKDYDGPRDSSGIISYMKRISGPSSKEIKDLSHLKKFLSSADGAVVMGFFESDSSLKKEFLKGADEMRDSYKFAHTSAADVLGEYGHKDDIVMFRPERMKTKLEESVVKYTGKESTSALKSFLEDNVHGIAGHMTPDNRAQFKQPLCVAYYKVDYTRNPKGTNYWRNRVIKVARDYTDKMNFAIASKEDFGRELSDYGESVKADTDDVNVVCKNSGGEKFVMTEKFSIDTFKKFMEDYFAGNIEAYIKSEPIPEDNSGPVKVVVGKNFNEIVNDETKDVLIEFYAPWCGHCKTLEPKYNELGEKLKEVEDIVIAKMDATANDVNAPFNVKGFPTIYWAPKGGKSNPQVYQGGREMKDFLEFIQREATTPFQLDEKKKKKQSKEDL